MGRILAQGLLRAGWASADLVLAEQMAEAAAEARQSTGLTVLLEPASAVAGRDVIAIAVKPNDVGHLLSQIVGAVTTDQIVVSLAAGVPISVYEDVLDGVPVVRSMPNTPAAVGEAMTAFCGGAFADKATLAVASSVLAAIGQTVHLDENLLDAVTAVSGSGPAYVFLLAEALTEAAMREGLPVVAAEQLVRQTLFGSSLLLSQSDKTASELRAQVTSPGGTTAAAIGVFETGEFKALVASAVQSAARRSRELGESAGSGAGEAG